MTSRRGQSNTRGDVGKLIGMTGWLESRDLEEGCESLLKLGFDGVGVIGAQIGSRLIGAPVFDGHFAAAGNMIRESGLVLSTLNVIEEAPAFDPHGGPEARHATAARLAEHLRHAAIMGAPAILIWDGRVNSADLAASASNQLAECIDEARKQAALGGDHVEVSVELHPFTFALRYKRMDDLATALGSVGAGFCVDFCHFAVALGRDFQASLGSHLMAAVTEIHYADSDCLTSEFHYPAGRGVLDLAALEAHFAGRGVPVSLDIFQWPAPIRGARESMPSYRPFVAAQATRESMRGDAAR
jgi:sugar phosphate isomerase/epimerase